jgi:hypothetical protein
LTKVSDGLLPKQHPISELFKGKVMNIYRVARDRSVNDDIEEFGAHLGGGPRAGKKEEDFFNAQEYLWYKNKKAKQ